MFEIGTLTSNKMALYADIGNFDLHIGSEVQSTSPALKRCEQCRPEIHMQAPVLKFI
jgi:hypothetical protein